MIYGGFDEVEHLVLTAAANLPAARNQGESIALPGKGSSSGTQDAQRLSYSRLQAAQILGISVESLDRLVRRGLLRPSRALRRPLFSLESLRRFLEETR